MAQGGTLFLDEVSEIGPHLQAKLLRVLQEREDQRMGETQSRKADVRIIAATNRRLKERIAEGSFRDDLYYRLNVVSISLPPLRERKEDIPVLADHFLNRAGGGSPDRARSFSPLSMQALLEYTWPGNVRELENAVERAKICSRGAVIEESAPLRDILSRCQWNRRKAAAQMGISRVTLWRKMKSMGIEG